MTQNKVIAVAKGGQNIISATANQPKRVVATAISARIGQTGASGPTGGGFLYVESGALKYRGSSGTITTLGAA